MIKRRHWFELARRHRSAWLLLAPLAGILLYPLFADNDARRTLLSVFARLVLGGASHSRFALPTLTLSVAGQRA